MSAGVNGNLTRPPVYAVFPPRSAYGARSSSSTRAPCSRAANAALMAAFPPPTTTTSGRPMGAPIVATLPFGRFLMLGDGPAAEVGERGGMFARLFGAGLLADQRANRHRVRR